MVSCEKSTAETIRLQANSPLEQWSKIPSCSARLDWKTDNEFLKRLENNSTGCAKAYRAKARYSCCLGWGNPMVSLCSVSLQVLHGKLAARCMKAFNRKRLAGRSVPRQEQPPKEGGLERRPQERRESAATRDGHCSPKEPQIATQPLAVR